jgi:hypothetical protein
MIQVTVLSDEGTLPPIAPTPEFLAEMCVLAMVMERDHATQTRFNQIRAGADDASVNEAWL